MARATNQEYLAKLRAQLAEAEAKAAARAAAEQAAQQQKLEALNEQLAAEQTKKQEAIVRVTNIHNDRISKVEQKIVDLKASMAANEDVEDDESDA